jgi:putative exosortase-associated protein (TIGR04073 family)
LILLFTFTITAVSYGADGVGIQLGHKLVRGVANTFTGWVEIPKQVYLETTEGSIPTGTVKGIVQGVGMAFARTTAGLYDIATFPIPVPWHYQPLFEPEYVWQDEVEAQATETQ